MSTTTCIYCLKTESAPFPKEHVLPQAFGHFRDNLTLNSVCGECNSLFARELELFLARDSVEALFRVRHGLKTKGKRQKLGTSRLNIKVTSTGDWCGALVTVERDETGTALRAEPLPQVAFRGPGEAEWKWILEEELEQTQQWECYRADAQTEIQIVGKQDSIVKRIADKLTALGIAYKELVSGRHGLEVEAFAQPFLDDTIFRGVAKIAFNFLACSQGARFALMLDFNPIRDYIRLGTKPPQSPVSVTSGPILRGDNAFCGHDIVLRRNDTEIACLVSLFNHQTYRVLLCSDYSGVVWHPFSEWNRFDLRTRAIRKSGSQPSLTLAYQ